MEKKFAAILFDLDGTLVDSAEAVSRAWVAFATKYNMDAAQILSSVQGMPGSEAIARLRPLASAEEIEQDAQWLEDLEANDTDGVVALPGAIALLEQLNAQAIPWAIVTSGSIPIATARIAAAGIPVPAVLITPEAVSQGKPHPEPYLLGAEKLGVEIDQCLVFEDAPAGVTSGVSAGACVIGIQTQFDAGVLMANKAAACISGYEEIVVSVNCGENRCRIHQASGA
ncbi:HAD-IA family hydrolase [Photobacterium sp. GJ3]|uniref:HAD-IA family hydrolase n=1 Tax=Photobacterium sp. GJ3 TaxID=2829502 RepID=UPI001B8CC2A6|nr:HAD-IA family hydrolase [Photobacterium sp. GJ3]QUJ68666.1 HAD-IA family hydrolase [Photobacterium sp. GJ3]